MKSQSKLSLVKGSFTKEEALDVLMNLFSSKINFHSLKNFSSMERFGKEDSQAVKRIPELEESKRIIAAMIKNLGDTEDEIEIQSDVIITLHKKKKRGFLQEDKIKS